MSDVWTVTQGTAKTIGVPLRDSTGAVITGTFDGTQALLTTVSPGGTQAISFTATTVWNSPAAGTITITITDAQSASVPPGDYDLLTTLNDNGSWVEAYDAIVTIVGAPGGYSGVPTSSMITRLAVEIELIDRDGALLMLVGKADSATGSNPNLTGAIGFAAQRLGVTPLIPGSIADSDLANFDPSLFYTICDLAEYRLIRTCGTGFTQPNQTTSLKSQEFNTMMLRFQAIADGLEKQYAALLNIRKNPIVGGRIKAHFPTFGDRRWGVGHGRYDH